ncbi:RNA-directed DNA polymerase, eukaryota [Tanacetum coccineum]
MFRKNNSTVSDYFVAIQGVWIPNAKNCLISFVYAPQEVSEKKMLWNYLNHVIDNWSGDIVIMGDFNEVRSKDERYGSLFNAHSAAIFNSFISSGGLVEVPLGGRMGSCPNISAITLDRYLSDHRPILLREACFDYCPIPFRLYHYWFEWEGFDKFVEETWVEMNISDSNAISKSMKKLKCLKEKIRLWTKAKKESSRSQKSKLKGMLSDIDSLIDNRYVDQTLLNKRLHVMNSLHDPEKLESLEIDQKAKIKWSIEGDENSKYFMEFLTRREINLQFVDHFDRPCSSRLLLDRVFPNRLNSDQIDNLERNVTKEEIKRAVWDCGTDKSPGPDGFTFGFYRRYWGILEKDVVDEVSYFFKDGTFPRGGNSSFIALIPKTQDAKLVKDYRPISLIGSMYKIIAKILANRLVVVLGDIVNEKKESMIFKIDFERAYDSVRWDYLDDVLNNFGFGTKWRGWIQNCLHSSRGSILVNESPAGEFQFQKGLKQGDPLSLFLFILIMEILHLSFQKLVDEGLFKGISLSSSLQLSHLFYADDVIFMGKWSDSNITTIVHTADSKEKKMSWVKWSRVLASKEKGGLGVSSFFALNRALMFKWVWRFRNDSNSLRSRFIKALHGEDGRLEKLSKLSHPSEWMNIVNELYMLKNQVMDLLSLMKKKVGNDLGYSLHRTPKDGVEMMQFLDLKANIDGVQLPSMQDRWIWSLVGSGDFSVASAKKYIDDHLLLSSPSRTRWVKAVPIKINIMAWKVRFDFLSTRLNLSRRGLKLQSVICPYCNKEVESTSHTFFACSMVRDLYRNIASWWDIRYSEFSSYEEWLEWFLDLRIHSDHRAI